jgi:hypothetical protein
MTEKSWIGRLFGMLILIMSCFPTAPNVFFRNVAAQDTESQQAAVNVRFHNHIEIFSPQTPITLEVQPKILLAHESLSDEKGFTLNIAVSKKKQPNPAASASETSKNPVTELEVFIPAFAGNTWLPASFLAPIDEGIYEITVSIQRKEERSANNRSLLNFSANPLQRRSPKIIAETVVHCIVLNPNPVTRPVGNLDSMKKELPQTDETTNPIWRRHLPYIPIFPKVGHFPSPKIPELPKFTGFRDRTPAKNPVTPMAGTSPTGTESGVGGLENKPVNAEQPPTPLDALYEQWKSGMSGRFGSGNLKQNPSAAVSTVSIPTLRSLSADSSTPIPAANSILDRSASSIFSVLTPATKPNVVSWEALPLSVTETNNPYLIELDYPADIPQTLGIGVVEMLSDGNKIVPVLTTDSGICVTEEIVSDQIPGQIATHRMLFWAKTKQPMLLLTNSEPQHDAQFGDIRLYDIVRTAKSTTESTAEPQKIETPFEIPKRFDGQPRRLVIGYFHRAEFLDKFNLAGSTDWQTIYENSTRMIADLRQSGYDGAMITVASNESLLYPSEKLAGINACDNNAMNNANKNNRFSASPTFCYCKDTLELLTRIFDREQLTLIPAIDFNFPIPELEKMIQTNPAFAEELLWNPSDPSARPRYNLLHPTVQKVLLGIIRELSERYSKHPSFGGITVLLTPDGSSRLPLIHRELDDRTFLQFWHDVQKDDSAKGCPDIPPELIATDSATRQQRKISRAGFVQSDPKAWSVWLRWRTRNVRDFYAEAAKIVAKNRSDARLYLSAGTILDQPEIQSYCLPSLSRWPSPVYVLQMLGFDPPQLAETPSLVFLRPHRVSNHPDDTETASYTEFDTVETGKQFLKQGSLPGVLFYHRSPYVPAEYRNRRRFVKQLAQSDVGMFIDGGRKFPSGGEDAVYDLLAAFRQLPAIAFQTFSQHEKTSQPVTVRFAKTSQGLIVYLVNDAPFGVGAELTFSAVHDVSVTELSGRRHINPITPRNNRPVWQITLKPYDLVAMILHDPQASIVNVDINCPSSICGVNGILRQKVDQLSQLIHTVNGGIIWDKLENPDFEIIRTVQQTAQHTPQYSQQYSHDAQRFGEIAGWKNFGSPTFNAQLDSEVKNSGQSSLKLSETANMNQRESGMILCDPFEVPETGQIYVSAFIGIADSVAERLTNRAVNNVTNRVMERAEKIPLEVVLSARQRNGEPLFFSYEVESVLLPLIVNAPPQHGVRWHRLIIPFDRLPPNGLDDFRIGFRLSAPGTVWIDNVTLYRMTFTSNEIKALQQLVLVAHGRCSAERVSDLLTILEGYWSRYLFRHVPLPSGSAPPASVASKETGRYASQVFTPTSPKITTNSVTPAPATPQKKEDQSIFNRVKGWFVK